MADVDMTKNVVGTSQAGARATRVLHQTVDFAEDNLAWADVAQLFDVGEGDVVERVRVKVLRAEGSAATVDIGDGDTADGFLGGVDVNTEGNAETTELTLVDGTPNTVSGYTAGKVYDAADTVDLAPSTGLSNAKLEVTALVSSMQ